MGGRAVCYTPAAFQSIIFDRGDIRYLRQVYGLGCPYNCGFCTIQTSNRKPDYFAIDRVLAEIRAYRRHDGASHNVYWGRPADDRLHEYGAFWSGPTCRGSAILGG